MSNPATEADPSRVPAPSGEYRMDPARSSVAFSTRHMFGLGGVRGSFSVASGQITVADPAESCAAAAVIDATSFSTGNPARDGQVRSKTYLDTDTHPEIVFASTDFHRQDGQWLLEGTLTVRDSTQPVRLVVGELAAGGGELTARGTTRIDRFEFGITAMKGMTGRYLDMSVELVAVAATD